MHFERTPHRNIPCMAGSGAHCCGAQCARCLSDWGSPAIVASTELSGGWQCVPFSRGRCNHQQCCLCSLYTKRVWKGVISWSLVLNMPSCMIVTGVVWKVVSVWVYAVATFWCAHVLVCVVSVCCFLNGLTCFGVYHCACLKHPGMFCSVNTTYTYCYRHGYICRITVGAPIGAERGDHCVHLILRSRYVHIWLTSVMFMLMRVQNVGTVQKEFVLFKWIGHASLFAWCYWCPCSALFIVLTE